MPKHFVSATCQGEVCGMCSREGKAEPATHKVGEEIASDDPRLMQHNFTQYVCCDHFCKIMGSTARFVICKI